VTEKIVSDLDPFFKEWAMPYSTGKKARGVESGIQQ
jgi:hypothetical protein